jgi:hypothetical protein
MAKIRLPDDQERLTILGATGSGKTVAGLWHLSQRNIDSKPWIIYDYKLEAMIAEIGAEPLSVHASVPARPGLFVVRPLPDVDNESVERQMWEIWERNNVGVYIDEGLMIGQYNRAFRALLTQGRTKHIPIIICSQRPAFLDVFVFSESSFFQVFRLQRKKDTLTVQEYIHFDIQKRLPPFYSYYYDVARNQLNVLSPTPDFRAIKAAFQQKLSKLRKVV